MKPLTLDELVAKHTEALDKLTAIKEGKGDPSERGLWFLKVGAARRTAMRDYNVDITLPYQLELN